MGCDASAHNRVRRTLRQPAGTTLFSNDHMHTEASRILSLHFCVRSLSHVVLRSASKGSATAQSRVALSLASPTLRSRYRLMCSRHRACLPRTAAPERMRSAGPSGEPRPGMHQSRWETIRFVFCDFRFRLIVGFSGIHRFGVHQDVCSLIRVARWLDPRDVTTVHAAR